MTFSLPWELNQEQRRRQLRECHKTIGLISKNNRSARPARAFSILIHFFAVLILTTTWNDQIWGHLEDESTWRSIFNFLSKYLHRSHQFYSCNVDSYSHCRAVICVVTQRSSPHKQRLLSFELHSFPFVWTAWRMHVIMRGCTNRGSPFDCFENWRPVIFARILRDFTHVKLQRNLYGRSRCLTCSSAAFANDKIKIFWRRSTGRSCWNY